jgi:hypothetical protein
VIWLRKYRCCLILVFENRYLEKLEIRLRILDEVSLYKSEVRRNDEKGKLTLLLRISTMKNIF